ncbi:alpha/beta hydrolase [Sphingobium sp.]|uniref:alpha/beta fold hydrolase n=1 Tax=Sphingobium sp. TaxID=1912891 RepID=UPI0028BF3D3D|nr:alpha/beta hydrolase [Sphingobium sp.]
MPFITSNGCRLHVVVEGPDDDVPVMLSHYLGGRLETFDGQMPLLAGRRVIRFDTRGHGLSEAPEGDYSVEMLGRDALAILDALGLDRVDFVGVSQGGMTGMWLASQHPARIGRLVLANTTPFIPNKPVWDELAAKARSEGMADIAHATISSWLSDGFRSAHPDRVAALVNHMAGMPISGYVGNTHVLRDVDLRDALARIKAPTLVIGGAEDGPRGASLPVITASVQNGRSAILPQAAHLSHIENAPAFNAELAQHLAL